MSPTGEGEPSFAESDAVPEILKHSDGRSPRVEGLAGLPDTPRRREVRRLAAAMREVIEHLVSTTASAEQLEVAAAELEGLAATLGDLPTGLTYRGFAETANAGGLVRDPN
ncbi:MAG: hypothetical protein ACKO04_14790, partial [Actinomycetes bacterium]